MNGTVSVCRRARVTFGVNCSSFVAISNTWRTAEDAGPGHKVDASAIKQNIYVDDYLGSARTLEQGVALAGAFKRILAAGDFYLRGWTSNSPSFLHQLDPSTGAPGDESLVFWPDVAGTHIEFPRCLFPRENSVDHIEPHTFCDASIEAYAVVVYVRAVYKDGTIIVQHVKAGTKLAPRKAFSVPKLELNAALLGASLARFTQAAFTRPLHRRCFWTNSSVVRNWIHATAAFYQTFVSRRIGESRISPKQKTGGCPWGEESGGRRHPFKP